MSMYLNCWTKTIKHCTLAMYWGSHDSLVVYPIELESHTERLTKPSHVSVLLISISCSSIKCKRAEKLPKCTSNRTTCLICRCWSHDMWNSLYPLSLIGILPSRTLCTSKVYNGTGNPCPISTQYGSFCFIRRYRCKIWNQSQIPNWNYMLAKNQFQSAAWITDPFGNGEYTNVMGIHGSLK